MDLQKLIPEEKILLLDSSPDGKMELLKELLSYCLRDSPLSGNEKDSIWNSLKERELSMSTGIGQGVAIPHCSLTQVEEVKGLLALVKGGVDFDSVDQKPVKIIVLLLIPKNRADEHIKTMAAVARLLNNSEFRDKILDSASPGEAYKILTQTIVG